MATRSGHVRAPPERPSSARSRPPLDFEKINRAALAALPNLLKRWLPDGQRRGHEFIARNPTRSDRSPGSFKINLQTGRWADFATGQSGGDPISLAAFLFTIRQGEAATRLSRMLSIEISS